MKRFFKKDRFCKRYVTAPFRVFPNYIIIGAMKSGTSSLYGYLCNHPDVHPAFCKEIHYFDNNHYKGKSWYRAHFPMKRDMLAGQITGEASPYYLAHPFVPERMSRLLSDVKLIVLLRNPIDRAYSHYQHNYRSGKEKLSFKDALDIEDERLSREEKKIVTGRYSQSHHKYTYKARGRYAEQLQRWFQYFSRDRFLVLKSEDFFTEPEQVTNQVFNFLGLEPYSKIKYKKYNYYGPYSDMPEDIRMQLEKYFTPYNQALYDLLDVDYKW